MKRLIFVLIFAFVLSLSNGKYCKISSGNYLHLMCRPEDTKPIHFIRNDTVGCADNSDEAVARENIKTIDISTCRFEDFNLFKNFTELKFANFHEIKSLRKEAFVGLDQVEHISIRYSNAEVLDSAFSDLPNLREVSINDNHLKLSDLAFKGAHQLRSLSLLDWLRSSLPARFFQDLNNLEYLNLGHHFENLTDIDFYGLEKVKLLDLNMNHIRNLTGNSFNRLTSLKYLYLDNNRLSDLGTMVFADLQNLIFLNLESNQIEELNNGAFAGLSNLRCLLLYNNYLYTIEAGAFSTMKNLRKLDLTNNRLTALDENTFKGLDSLQYLRLRENSISSFAVNTFAILPKLSQLDLSRQRGWPHKDLESVDLNAFPQFIDLDTKSVIQSRINDTLDDFERAEMQWIKDILSIKEDYQLQYYEWKFFGSFQLNQNGYQQTDLMNLPNPSQNVSLESLVFGNLDLSENRITSVTLVKN